MHSTNAGNNLGVVVGGNGTGKSWLLGWVAEQLGVDDNNERTLFRIEEMEKHLFFDAQSFIRQCNVLMKLPKRKTVGYQLILDEGQLSLYSKEAFNQEVKNLSRMLMTVRSRRWGVYINLPSFGMLNKDVRMITNWMVQMKGKPSEYSYGTFYNIEVNMVTGDPYLKKPVFSTRQQTIDGVPIVKNVAYSILPFPKPSKDFIKKYEILKANHQRALYEKYGKSSDEVAEEKKEELPTKKTYEQMALEILASPERFKNPKGRWIKQKLKGFTGLGMERIEKLMPLLDKDYFGK